MPSMADIQTPFSRRTLLFAGGGVAAAIAAGGLTWARDSEVAEPGAAERTGPPPMAGEFDIRSGTELLAPTQLFNATGPQSFAFDDTNGLIYTLQTLQAAIHLSDEQEPVAAADRKRAGDMCLTRLTSTGEIIGYMYLRGFGHGISFGVEPVGKRTYLWVEGSADPRTGYGRSVARTLFKTGTTLDSSDPAVTHFDPVPGASDVTPSLDLAGGRVLVSHERDDEQKFAVYQMEDFLAGRTESARFINAGVQVREEEWFQGCALHGDFIYILTGNPYTGKSGANPQKSGGNTYISAIDVNTGKAQGRQRVTVAPDLPYREPEGMAISLAGGRPGLCIGFSVKTRDYRELTLYRFTS
ncbi:signaling protein [Streptomyces sp. NPDC059874]|uniref:phage baseplate protein n=1 Tax=Streptomyces sp. NPDC059874 TaxID=3346983 RepID=UPI00365FD3C3